MHANHIAPPPLTDLVLDHLPNGELAWLRQSADAGEPDDALYALTDQGRRAVAMASLFDPLPRSARCRDAELRMARTSGSLMTDLTAAAALLDADPDLAEALLNVVVNAWPHLTNQRRLELVSLAMTEEFRAVIAAEVIASKKP